MEEDFYVVLSYQGDKFEVEVTNPDDTIRLVIEKLVTELKLPKQDGGGNPSTYFLGRMDDDENLVILETAIDGREQSLSDYDIKSGDTLYLSMVPIAG